MIHSKEYTSNMKAYGLIEVLISMAIFALAVIALTSLNAKNYRQIKANEMADLANKFMISSLEYMKAPSTGGEEDVESVQDKIEEAMADTSDDVVCFYQAGYIGGSLVTTEEIFNIVETPCYSVSAGSFANDGYRLQPPLSPSCTNCCNNSSVYKMDTSSSYFITNLKGLSLCNQIVVIRNTNQRGYNIISRVVYDTGVAQTDIDTGTITSYEVNEIFGFRPYTYEGD